MEGPEEEVEEQLGSSKLLSDQDPKGEVTSHLETSLIFLLFVTVLGCRPATIPTSVRIDSGLSLSGDARVGVGWEAMRKTPASPINHAIAVPISDSQSLSSRTRIKSVFL